MLQSFMPPVMLVLGFIVASKLTDTMGGLKKAGDAPATPAGVGGAANHEWQ